MHVLYICMYVRARARVCVCVCVSVCVRACDTFTKQKHTDTIVLFNDLFSINRVILDTHIIVSDIF